MKTFQLYILMILALGSLGCSSYRMAPWATGSRWTLDGNTVAGGQAAVSIDFGAGDMMPISNASTGDWDLHFITDSAGWAATDANSREYITSAMRHIPLAVDSMEFALAERYIVFTPSVVNRWLPDIVRLADGAEVVVEANPLESAMQPHDQIWRNVIFDDKLKRLLVVDRFVKNGRHLAVVYILQSETPRVPFASTFHYDVTARRNTQPVGEHLRYLLDITIDAARPSQGQSR